MQKNLNISAPFIGIVFLCLSMLGGISAQAAKQPRNIVVIMADDLGYGDVGCFGAKTIATPNIDQLATDGKRFTHVYSTPVCTATRYEIFCGQHYWRPGNKESALLDDAPLIIPTDRTTGPSMLKQAGFKTALIGKWHLGFGETEPDWNGTLKPGPLEIGLDEFFGIPCNNRIAPYVLVENHHVVGLDPADPIRGFRGRHPVTEQIGGDAARWDWENLGKNLTAKAVDYIERNSDDPFCLFFFPHHPHTFIRPHPDFHCTAKSGLRGDFIQELDWCVGEVLDALEREGIAEDTLVMFTSDNGPTIIELWAAELKAHDMTGGLRDEKGTVYEGGVRIPMVVRWPGVVSRGSESDALLDLVDIPATLADVVGSEIPEAFEDSFSFAHVLQGKPPQEPARPFVIHNCPHTGDFAIQQGPWKLVLIKEKAPELYNLEQDRAETKNVAAKHGEIVKKLQRLFDTCRARSTRDLVADQTNVSFIPKSN